MTTETARAEKPVARAQAKPSILELSRQQLDALLVELGEPRYRAGQLWRAVYHEGRASFAEMTTLTKGLRAKLEERFSIDPFRQVLQLRSKDGSTDKALFRLADGEMIETVLMRYEPDAHRKRRRTVCVSTQAGCALGCTFCATGQQGFRRQLTTGEIVGQVLYMSRLAMAEDRALIESGEITQGDAAGITNVVFMGMGEPFANYDRTMAAIRVLNDGHGVGIGARHITVSTVGLVPQILKFAEEPLQVNLAVSLHAPDDATRSETMPVTHRYPVAALMDACRRYVEKTGRRVFFEYVLLSGQNDTNGHANRLGGLLKGMLCHVNLIPVNPTGEGPYSRPASTRSEEFQAVLLGYGVPSTVRVEKGIDIAAGCGQLRARVLASEEADATA
jgi:23S rRNA (adenine2503-C2)-methyltransferase